MAKNACVVFVFKDGIAYSILVFPGTMKMNPNGEYMSLEVARHIDTLLQQGATIILPHDAPVRAFNLDVNKDKQLQTLVSSFYHRENKEIFILKTPGKMMGT